MHHQVRPFPLGRHLVHPSRDLDPPKHEVAHLEFAGADMATMVAAQSLLVACRSHNCPTTNFLQEVDVIDPLLHLSVFFIGTYPGRPMLEFRREYGLSPIDEGEGRLAGSPTWR